MQLTRMPSYGIVAIGLDAGPLSHWLHKGLIDAGFEAVLMEKGDARFTRTASKATRDGDRPRPDRLRNSGSCLNGCVGGLDGGHGKKPV